jgi:hypothetical protein
VVPSGAQVADGVACHAQTQKMMRGRLLAHAARRHAGPNAVFDGVHEWISSCLQLPGDCAFIHTGGDDDEGPVYVENVEWSALAAAAALVCTAAGFDRRRLGQRCDHAGH